MLFFFFFLPTAHLTELKTMKVSHDYLHKPTESHPLALRWPALCSMLSCWSTACVLTTLPWAPWAYIWPACGAGMLTMKCLWVLAWKEQTHCQGRTFLTRMNPHKILLAGAIVISNTVYLVLTLKLRYRYTGFICNMPEKELASSYLKNKSM